MIDQETREAIADLWKQVAEPASASTLPASLTVSGRRGHLPAHHAVEVAATAAISVALLAAAAIDLVRGMNPPDIEIDRSHVAAAMRSGAVFRWKGRPLALDFAPLSRFWEVQDGWIRTHANYPWHRDALLRVLGLDSESETEVASSMRRWSAKDLETAVCDAGGVAAAFGSPKDWLAHPQAASLRKEPLIGRLNASAASPRPLPRATLLGQGLRVLDLTRVIAGPVCTRYLGALGASVLRIDPPDWPDLPRDLPADTLLGKRSATVDFRDKAGQVVLEGLLSEADIVVLGYRPGALDRFGLSWQSLGTRFPGLVIVVLNAWGHDGPWKTRRGFDSIVQAATGIAWIEGGGSGKPGTLPCQLLDHATGYLAAAAALDGIFEQRTQGGTPVRRLSLARTAQWLMRLPKNSEPGAPKPQNRIEEWMIDLPDARGIQRFLSPVGRWNGQPLQWSHGAAYYGSDSPKWQQPCRG